MVGVFGIEEEKVMVNVMFFGGVFGRKFKFEFVVEVVVILKEIGSLIKLLWIREDDI